MTPFNFGGTIIELEDNWYMNYDPGGAAFTQEYFLYHYCSDGYWLFVSPLYNDNGCPKCDIKAPDTVLGYYNLCRSMEKKRGS